MSWKYSNKVIFRTNKMAGCCKNRNILKQAWSDFGRRQLNDEKRYLEGLLDINDLGVIFRKVPKQNSRWGQRNADLIYGFWKEEDIRIKLSNELSKFPYSQVHGQVHAHGIRNKRKYQRKHNMHVILYPDLTFMSFKRKERGGERKEENIESTAIELKHLNIGENKNRLRGKISEDFNKLKSYQIKRVTPRFDSGYFFCIDESKKAEEVVKILMKTKRYRSCRLGYGILMPRYTSLDLQFPRFLEEYERGESRKIAYILDYIRAGLKEDYSGNVRIHKDYIYGMHMIFRQNLNWFLEIYWPKYLKGSQNRYLYTVIYFGLKHSKIFKRYLKYRWDCKSETLIKDNEKGDQALILKIHRGKLNSLRSIEKYGAKIITIVKKLIRNV